jgi:NAD(P)-dependent dehydrogenase (short-subunit alcohol dehydrogenase family)
MNNNVLITGASRGLGYALTIQYLKNGYTVFACARNREETKLTSLKEEFNDNLHILQMDIAISSSVKEAAQEASKYCNKLDIIINNAGIHPEGTLEILENVNLDNALEVYNVNSVGALRVAKEFLDLLQHGDEKILLNISSEAGSISNCPRSKEFHYCMSKAAMNMGSMLLQNYLKERNIKVLAVHPGWIRTDMGGTNADLAPLEAAQCILDLTVNKKYQMDDPVFIDRYGKELSW